jgi:hypothetical protein
VQQLTDGDYALVHLFEEDEEYYNMFQKAVADGREVILDNSIFELGTAFNSKVFASWVLKLRPTWYIVPDVLNDRRGTVAQFNRFVDDFGNLPGKRIGVVQGATYGEAVECYRAIKDRCDMIAFSFDSEWYGSTWERKMRGRAEMLTQMYLRGIIDTKKPHHLLGVALPQEMCLYSGPEYDFIRSVDTSNPVVHGIKKIPYTMYGLSNKESVKLFTLINAQIDDDQMFQIEQNIDMFRRFCRGEA